MTTNIFSRDLMSGQNPKLEKPVSIEKLFSGVGREFLEISIKANSELKKHKAPVPIAVYCLEGAGVFVHGEDLDVGIKLIPGVLLTLEANRIHEVRAESDLRMLLIKFSEAHDFNKAE